MLRSHNAMEKHAPSYTDIKPEMEVIASHLAQLTLQLAALGTKVEKMQNSSETDSTSDDLEARKRAVEMKMMEAEVELRHINKDMQEQGYKSQFMFVSKYTDIVAAVNHGSVLDVEYLADHGYDLNAREDGKTLLELATDRDSAEIVQALAYRGASLHQKYGEWEGTLLHYAAFHKALNVVRLLLDLGHDVHALDNEKSTPLHSACYGGSVEVVRLLLDRGADVNAQGNDKWTPLHCACYGGHVAVARLLLDRDADAEARTVAGRRATDCANGPDAQRIRKLLMHHHYYAPYSPLHSPM